MLSILNDLIQGKGNARQTSIMGIILLGSIGFQQYVLAEQDEDIEFAVTKAETVEDKVDAKVDADTINNSVKLLSTVIQTQSSQFNSLQKQTDKRFIEIQEDSNKKFEEIQENSNKKFEEVQGTIKSLATASEKATIIREHRYLEQQAINARNNKIQNDLLESNKTNHEAVKLLLERLQYAPIIMSSPAIPPKTSDQ